MSSLFYVFIGGGLGSLCRYGIGQAWDSSHFYLGTFLANVISCLILGFLIGMSSESLLKSPHRLLLMTGFCGGFSTFSTFSGELVQLYQGGQTMAVGLYLVGSIIAGVIAILVGLMVAKMVIS